MKRTAYPPLQTIVRLYSCTADHRISFSDGTCPREVPQSDARRGVLLDPLTRPRTKARRNCPTNGESALSRFTPLDLLFPSGNTALMRYDDEGFMPPNCTRSAAPCRPARPRFQLRYTIPD